MFRSVIHRIVVSGGGSILRNSRNFSLLSVHSSFPATLHRFQLKRESQLYDKKLQHEDSEADDAVNIAPDGLVYPEISDLGASNFLFLLLHFTLSITSFKRSSLHAKHPLVAGAHQNVIGLLF